MAENNRKKENIPDQRENNSSQKEQGSMNQNRSSRQDVSNEQSGRMESQPGSMSGVNTENQRSRSGNLDLGSRGSDMESKENF